MSEGSRPAAPPACNPFISGGHFARVFRRSFSPGISPGVLPAGFLFFRSVPAVSPSCFHPSSRLVFFVLLHMSFYVYLLLGFLGGIPAGMGMGGGTVTIPLLVLVGGVEQKIAQSANLFSFFPMSAGALRVHAQNGLLETEGILWIILPALLFSAAGALLAYVLPSAMLRRAFGVFLVILSFFQFRSAFSGEN